MRRARADGAASDRLTKLVNALKAAPAGDVSKDDVALFLGADGAGGGAGLLAWPLPLLFPCLDLFRLLMLHPKAAPLLVSADPPVLPRLLSLLNTAQAAGADSKPAGAASLMLLRCLANAASKRELRQALAQTAADQLDALSKPLDEGPPPARLAACSVLYNLTIVDWRSLPGSDWTVRMEGWTLQALSLLSHALTNVPSLQTAAEEESLHRLPALHAMLGGVLTRPSSRGHRGRQGPRAARGLQALSLPQGRLTTWSAAASRSSADRAVHGSRAHEPPAPAGGSPSV